MKYLDFIVEEQTLRKNPKCSSFEKIVKGSRGYLCARFAFGMGWSGCKIAASFWSLGKEYPVVVTRGKCIIPADALQYVSFEVQVTGIAQEGKYKIVTNKLKIAQGE